MKKYIVAIFLPLLVLAGCGFHLKGMSAGDAHLSYKVWSVEGGDLKNALERQLKRQPGVIVETSGADVVVKTVSYQQSRSISAVDIAGGAAEFQLDLHIVVQAYRHGEPLGTPIMVTVQRYMDYVDNFILGKQQEEQAVWRDMRTDAAEQIVRRLAYLPEVP